MYRQLALCGLIVCVAAAYLAAASRSAAVPLAGETSHAPAGAGVSPIIYPEQRIPLRFSHVQHLTLPGAELSCASCHRDASTSDSALDRLIPAESACTGCHAIDRGTSDEAAAGQRAAQCRACHPGHEPGGQIARIEIPRPNIKFSHRLHAGRGISCVRCHGDLAQQGVALATREHLPRMAACMTCHDGERASSACTTCHLAAAGSRMQTRYDSGVLLPSGALAGAAHDLSFRTEHGAVAQNNSAYCESCHRTSECVSCHDGVAKPLDFHGNDYVAMHAVDARRDRLRCITCHRGQTFCVGCHSRSGVAADGRGSEFSAERRFHPSGWTATGQIGPDHHALHARRNIRQCASCHREQFCVRCHSAEVATPRINPHPPGWAQSYRCRALVRRAGRMCLRCHVGAEPVTCE